MAGKDPLPSQVDQDPAPGLPLPRPRRAASGLHFLVMGLGRTSPHPHRELL